MKLSASGNYSATQCGAITTIWYTGQYAGLNRNWRLCHFDIHNKTIKFINCYESNNEASIKLVTKLINNHGNAAAVKKLESYFGDKSLFNSFCQRVRDNKIIIRNCNKCKHAYTGHTAHMCFCRNEVFTGQRERGSIENMNMYCNLFEYCVSYDIIEVGTDIGGHTIDYKFYGIKSVKQAEILKNSLHSEWIVDYFITISLED